MEFFDSRKTGDLCSRLQSDISKIENAISNQFAVLVSSTIYLIICIFILFFISSYMTLFTIGIILPMIIIGPLYGGYLRKINKKISDAKAESTDICQEVFSNIRTVKAFATENFESIRFGLKNDLSFYLGKKSAIAGGFFQFIITILIFGSLDA